MKSNIGRNLTMDERREQYIFIMKLDDKSDN